MRHAGQEDASELVQALEAMMPDQPAAVRSRVDAALAAGGWSDADAAKLRLMRARALTRTGEVVLGIEEMRRAADTLAEAGADRDLAMAWVYLGGLLINLVADFAEGARVLEQAIGLAERCGDAGAKAEAMACQGILFARMGRQHDAEQSMRQALALMAPLELTGLALMTRTNLGYLLVETGRSDEACTLLLAVRDDIQTRLDRADPTLPPRVARQRLSQCEQCLAEAYAQSGRHAEALALLNALDAKVQPTVRAYDWICIQLSLAEAHLAAGHLDEALACAQRTVDFGRSRGLLANEVEALRVLSVTLERLGRWAEAIDVERALRRAERKIFDDQAAMRVSVMEAGTRLRTEQAAREALARANAELEQRVQQRSDALRREVAQRQEAEARARYWSEHDWLTGLLSRTRLDELLGERLASASARRAGDAVLFVDLDGFKHINDVHGHRVGDEVLRSTAQRLREVAAGCEVARFGGDEFVVLRPAAADESPAAAEQAALALAEQVCAAVARDTAGLGHAMALSASVGVALLDPALGSAEEVLRQADRAMLSAKRAGGNRCERLHPRLKTEMDRRARLRRDLPEAIAERQLQPWLQPLARGRSGEVPQYELLARWKHPSLGWVSPTEFVPLAEDCGAIHALGCWALGEAVTLAQALAPYGRPVLGVNLSCLQLERPDIADELRTLVLARGGRPEQIMFELTETVQLGEDAQYRARIDEIKQAGFGLALDDFGRGWSSFEYLSRVRFDHLKIDRSLVVAAAQQAADRALIAAIVAMARALGIVVVAEGAETEAQRELLQDCGVDLLQGYLIGRPMNPRRALRWARQRKAAAQLTLP